MTCMVESVWSCRAERERDATRVGRSDAGRRGTAVCSMSPYIYKQTYTEYSTRLLRIKKESDFFLFCFVFPQMFHYLNITLFTVSLTKT